MEAEPGAVVDGRAGSLPRRTAPAVTGAADGAAEAGAPSIAIICAQKLEQELLGALLASAFGDPGLQVFGRAEDMSSGPDGAAYDLVILGYLLQAPRAEALLSAARLVHERSGRTPVAVIASAHDGELVNAAIRNGARCFIPTTLPVNMAVAAIKLVLSGGAFVPAAVGGPEHAGDAAFPQDEPPAATNGRGARAEMSRDAQVPADPAGQFSLSRREREVLRLLQAGLSNKQIGAELRISENTVMVHVQHLMRKLGARNRTQAALMAKRIS